jgi:predicted secreted hydrolase
LRRLPIVCLVLVLAGTGCNPATEPEKVGPDATGPAAIAAGGSLSELARHAGEFEQAMPGKALTFPADHGAHPGFRLEWWYLTANLADHEGVQYGAQWTLFRLARFASQDDSRWSSREAFMAHMAVSSAVTHEARQRYARGGGAGHDQAGVTAEPFAAWLDDWSLQSDDPDGGWLPLSARAFQDDIGFELRLSSDRPPVLQGDGGFSQKHPGGGGSHYYSHPWLTAQGTLHIGGKTVSVEGQAWFDHEWSSQFLQPDQQGWDWMALHLDSGEKLMAFRLRSAGGEPWRHAVLLHPNGARTSLASPQVEMIETEWANVAGRRLPVGWQVRLESGGRSFQVRAMGPNHWMDLDFSYWEGPVEVIGASAQERGKGFLEMTGYPPADRAPRDD